MKRKVLIVDDEPSTTDMLKEVLAEEPYEILSAGNAVEGLKILTREDVDVVISDEMMPGMSGTEFLAVVRREYPETIRMVLTGYPSLKGAIRAINEGEIYRFFQKPCNMFDLAIGIRQALQQRDLMRESRRLLELARQQSDLIESLEKTYPGITRVRKDAAGKVILEEERGEESLDGLVSEIDALIKHCEGHFD